MQTERQVAAQSLTLHDRPIRVREIDEKQT